MIEAPMPLILSTLLLAPLAANPSVLDGTWHLVAVEEDGQAVAPGTATLTVRNGRFEARDDKGALDGLIVLDSTKGLLDLSTSDGTSLIAATYRLENGALRICWCFDDTRPAGVASGKGRTVVTYRDGK
jgi:uncharacterized protein (TIGR03067 family)